MVLSEPKLLIEKRDTRAEAQDAEKTGVKRFPHCTFCTVAQIAFERFNQTQSCLVCSRTF